MMIGDPRRKQADELFPRVAPIHVQGEQTAIFVADLNLGSLQFYGVII